MTDVTTRVTEVLTEGWHAAAQRGDVGRPEEHCRRLAERLVAADLVRLPTTSGEHRVLTDDELRALRDLLDRLREDMRTVERPEEVECGDEIDVVAGLVTVLLGENEEPPGPGLASPTGGTGYKLPGSLQRGPDRLDELTRAGEAIAADARAAGHDPDEFVSTR